MGTHEIKKFSTSSLITRTTNDVTQVEMIVAMGLQLLIKAPITAIWAITKILNKNFKIEEKNNNQLWEKVLTFIEKNYSEKLQVQDICKNLFISERTFYYLFI